MTAVRISSVVPAVSLQALRLAIMLLSLGGLGGSLQPSRIVMLVGSVVALVALLGMSARLTSLDAVGVLFVAVLLAGGALSLAWTPAAADGASMLVVATVNSLAIALACACGRTPDVARSVRDAWTAALLLTLPIATYELLTGQHFAFALDDRDLGGDVGELPYASVFFGNYNNYSTFICLALPMMLGSLWGARNRLCALVILLAMPLAVLVLVVNASRLSLIVPAVLLLYAVVSRPRWGVPIALLVLPAAALALYLALPDDIDGLLMLLAIKFSSVFDGDESAGQRLAIITVGLDALRASIGVGAGVGSFEHLLRSEHRDLIPNAHNLVLEIAVNFGTLPVLVLAVLLGIAWRDTWRSRCGLDLRIAALVTIPLVPAIGAINSQAVGYTYWWLWFASIIVIARGAKSEHAAAAQPPLRSVPSHRKRPRPAGRPPTDGIPIAP
jgi:hypothetical protein